MQIARTSALEEMISGIAHELNQPIGAIATFAQTGERMLAKAEPMVGPAMDLFRHISNEAMAAGKGIHGIRNLFNGRQAERELCGMPQIVDGLVPVLELLATRGAVKLQIAIQENLPQVSADRLRIQHVLFTLVQNAADAGQRNGGFRPLVKIDVAGDRYSVTTSVTDYGVGVGDEARKHLFRPFFTTKQNGTGLGLASSRAIVESHDGAIGFDQAADGGTRFWFRLPAATEGSTP